MRNFVPGFTKTSMVDMKRFKAIALLATYGVDRRAAYSQGIAAPIQPPSSRYHEFRQFGDVTRSLATVSDFNKVLSCKMPRDESGLLAERRLKLRRIIAQRRLEFL